MGQPSVKNWKLILIPFSWLYGIVVWIRNSLYDNGLIRSTAFNIPTILVGNITVGGTGKTPHVEYLVGLLKDHYAVATLSRGYLRKTREFRVASLDSTTREIGDEPRQIKNRFPDVTVAVDRKRVHGIEELMKLAPPLDVIVLDDAFQHRSLKAGFSILLIDYNRPMVSDQLLPAGMLREPAINRNRAQMILVTKSPVDIKPIEMREYVNRLGLELGQHLFFTTMVFGDLFPVFPDVVPKDLEHHRTNAHGVLMVSGVVHPGQLKEYAGEISNNIEEIRFPDHHRYSVKDLEQIHSRVQKMGGADGEVLILTTEKDAVKLRELDVTESIRSAMYAIRIHVKFLNGDQENFEKQINNYVTSNKRSSILHQGKD
jgi:tetraacyldisaccharide 4'-kinase